MTEEILKSIIDEHFTSWSNSICISDSGGSQESKEDLNSQNSNALNSYQNEEIISSQETIPSQGNKKKKI